MAVAYSHNCTVERGGVGVGARLEKGVSGAQIVWIACVPLVVSPPCLLRTLGSEWGNNCCSITVHSACCSARSHVVHPQWLQQCSPPLRYQVRVGVDGAVWAMLISPASGDKACMRDVAAADESQTTHQPMGAKAHG
jgi:hypothetical protein